MSTGTYGRGIGIKGSSSVTFNHGTYYLDGGGLNIQSPAAIVSGAGAVFYTVGCDGISGFPTSNYAPTTFGGEGKPLR